MINWSDGLSRTVGSCTLQHHDDVRPDDELLLGCILHALPDLEREDDEAEGEEAACQHQPHDRLLARREQQLHVPCVWLYGEGSTIRRELGMIAWAKRRGCPAEPARPEAGSPT